MKLGNNRPDETAKGVLADLGLFCQHMVYRPFS